MQQILIVEDDHILNQTLTYNLVSEGYRVDSAYTLAQAGNYSSRQGMASSCWT